jgi:hypothetical protein
MLAILITMFAGLLIAASVRGLAKEYLGCVGLIILVLFIFVLMAVVSLF